MGFTVNITEENDKLSERVGALEIMIGQITTALESTRGAIDYVAQQITQDKAANGDYGTLEPCECDYPHCTAQMAYEAQQARAVETVEKQTEGHYL